MLANEEVDRRQERGRRLPVVRRPLRQWMLQITAYADALLAGPRRRSTGPTARRRCSATGSAAAKAPRSTSRSTATPALTVCACSRRAPTRCSARPTWCSRPSTRSSRDDHDRGAARRGRRRTATQAARKSDLERTELREGRRPACSPARTRSIPSNGAKHPDLDRRLRARGLRHRRDHGGARRTTSATTSSRRRYDLPGSAGRAAAGRCRRRQRLRRRRRAASTAGFLDGLQRRRREGAR